MLGDAEAQLRLLPDRSVNAICTSPPYFGLRQYGADGEIGLEASPVEFTDRLISVFEQARRVLRNDGSCWVVIGDSYAASGKGRNPANSVHKKQSSNVGSRAPARKYAELKPKDLIGVPWRLAFALQDAGWYLRSAIIWQKPNPMPESTKDRCSLAHEFIFHLTKTTRYFHDWFAVAEKAQSDHSSGNGFKRAPRLSFADKNGARGNDTPWNNVGGVRNARSVWTITTEASAIKHFATYPTRLASRVIQAATSEAGCCAECGAPLQRILENGEPDEAWKAACGADSAGEYKGQSTKDYKSAKAQDASATKARILAGMKMKITVGWAPSCTCNSVHAPMPSIVLDPFSGVGTTGLCATRLGRDYIGIDLKSDYHDMAASRLTDPKAKCLDGNGSRLPFVSCEVQRT